MLLTRVCDYESQLYLQILSTVFTRKIFCDFLFAFQQTKSNLKGIDHIRQYVAPPWSKVSPL